MYLQIAPRLFCLGRVLAFGDEDLRASWISNTRGVVSDLRAIKGWRATERCNWCDHLQRDTNAILRDPAFVVLAPDEEGGRYYLTVMTTSHVSVLTDLTDEDMAGVLAGLSRVVHTIKRVFQVEDVQIRARPRPFSPSGGHLHFDLIPVPRGTTQEHPEDITALTLPPGS